MSLAGLVSQKMSNALCNCAVN